MEQPSLLPRHVVIDPASTGWRLCVDGRPFRIKGIGCNAASGENGEDYLAMAKRMGANAVRTWGDTDQRYLDRAHDLGLLVDVGIWFDPVRPGGTETYRDPRICDQLRRAALAHVAALKDHPALLFWNLGNEVFAFSEEPAERDAFGAFLRQLIDDVHRLDPRHPVVYAAAGARELPDLQRLVPNLDVLGVNTYDGLAPVLEWMDAHEYRRPLVVTEFGPLGSWDRPKDGNQLPHDPFDHFKARDYVQIWREIDDAADRCFGGFAFALGPFRNQDSLTWFNVNFGPLCREPYWALYELFTGNPPPNRAPRITSFRLSRSEKLAPREEIEAHVTAYDPDGDPLSFDYFITDIADDPLLVSPPRFFPVAARATGDGEARLQVPERPGFYRVYVAVADGCSNVAVANQSIHVAAAPASAERLAPGP